MYNEGFKSAFFLKAFLNYGTEINKLFRIYLHLQKPF